MIIPQTRLLIWSAIILLPFGLLISIQSTVGISALIVTCFLFLVLLDALFVVRKLEGITIETPTIVRLRKFKPGIITLLIRIDTDRVKQLRVGLALPRQFQAEEEGLFTLLPSEGTAFQLDYPCVPLQRGKFFVTKCVLQTESPLALWAWRKIVSVSTEVRVYPNLSRERKNLATLFLNRGFIGLHVQRQLGKGREFEKLRDYIPGDSYSDIHWKATAKRSRPITKVYQIERTQEIYVILDSSRLSNRLVQENTGLRDPRSRPPLPGTSRSGPLHAGQTILERFITGTLILGQAAEKQGDLFGLITFNDTVRHFLRARNGQEHYRMVREALYTLQPRTLSPDFVELTSFIRTRLRKRALLFFLTSLDDPLLAENFLKAVKAITRQHLVVVTMLRQPGIQPLFSDPTVHSLDDLFWHLGGHIMWQKMQEMQKVLKRQAIHFSLLDNEKMSLQLVSHYVKLKQRQLL